MPSSAQIFLSVFVVCLAAMPALGNTLPMITDVVVEARGDTLVIEFDLADPDGDEMTVLLFAAGTDLALPPDEPGVVGDIGTGIFSGPGKKITVSLSEVREGAAAPFIPRLLAHDGKGLGGEMISIESEGGPDFMIDKYEITNAQFAAFMRSDGYERMEFWIIDDGSIEVVETGWNYAGRFGWIAPRHWDSTVDPPWSTDPKSGSACSPVLGISWFEAYAYCKWAGRRLPTSGEWVESAGTREAQYPWGESFAPGASPPLFNLANIKYSYSGYESGGFTSDGSQYAAPVGSYSPRGDSRLGLVDVYGNVWEWCAEAVTVVDYGTYSCATRPLRGGSWATSAAELKDPSRDLCPLYRIDTAGFRCAR